MGLKLKLAEGIIAIEQSCTIVGIYFVKCKYANTVPKPIKALFFNMLIFNIPMFQMRGHYSILMTKWRNPIRFQWMLKKPFLFYNTFHSESDQNI